MQQTALTREMVRELDRRAIEEFCIPGIVLMENAGRGAAEKLCQLGVNGRVGICCGSGNNGGDGFVIARHLDLRGIEVQVLTWNCHRNLIAGGQRPPGKTATTPTDAEVNLKILLKSKLQVHFDLSPQELPNIFQGAAWIIDALLGTGSHGEPRSPIAEVIEAINNSGIPVLAIDLPSGLDCNTGQAAKHTIRAAHTCTFVAPKPGFFVPNAEQYTGQLHAIDIGAPRMLVEEMLRAAKSGIV